MLNLITKVSEFSMPTDVFGLFKFGKSSISFMDQVQYASISPVIQGAVRCLIRTYFKGAMLSITAISLDFKR